MEDSGEALHPLVEQGLDRLWRHVAAGKARAARRNDHVDCGIGDPALHLAADRFASRSASVVPDLSSSSERVSEIVSTAMPRGMKGRVSSMPGMKELLSDRRFSSAETTTLPSVSSRTKVSKPARPERIAGLDLSGFQARGEPTHALLGGAVGEAIGHYAALRLLLQPVVADGFGGANGLFDVAGLQ